MFGGLSGIGKKLTQDGESAGDAAAAAAEQARERQEEQQGGVAPAETQQSPLEDFASGVGNSAFSGMVGGAQRAGQAAMDSAADTYESSARDGKISAFEGKQISNAERDTGVAEGQQAEDDQQADVPPAQQTQDAAQGAFNTLSSASGAVHDAARTVIGNMR